MWLWGGCSNRYISKLNVMIPNDVTNGKKPVRIAAYTRVKLNSTAAKLHLALLKSLKHARSEESSEE